MFLAVGQSLRKMWTLREPPFFATSSLIRAVAVKGVVTAEARRGGCEGGRERAPNTQDSSDCRRISPLAGVVVRHGLRQRQRAKGTWITLFLQYSMTNNNAVPLGGALYCIFYVPTHIKFSCLADDVRTCTLHSTPIRPAPTPPPPYHPPPSVDGPRRGLSA